jgi:uncharacterized protein (TIGR02145 family)
MKLKYFAISLLFFSEFAIGQVPGTPKILFKNQLPQVFTLSAEINDFSTAVVKAQIIDNGQTPVSESGLVWGTSLPITINTNSGIFTKTGSGAFTSSITLNTLSPTPSSLVTYYIVAYATNDAGTTYGDVITYEHGSVKSQTGRIWLAYNLGAIKIPTTINDADGLGSLYQWGRESDGHEIVRPSASQTTTILSNTSSANNGGQFILGQNINTPADQQSAWSSNLTFADWLKTRNEELWQGKDGRNNPCPSGYRLPKIEEFQNEVSYFSSSNSTGAFTSILKLTTNGKRNNNTGSIAATPTTGYYWTSNTYYKIASQSQQPAYYMGRLVVITSANITFPTGEADGLRAQGMGVRCIKD